MKWTILLSLFAFSNASTELNCAFWQPFHDSGFFCESCGEIFLRKLTEGRTPTADDIHLAGTLVLSRPDFTNMEDCVCPLIFADKWCKPCAKPTQWYSMQAENAAGWNEGFVDYEGKCDAGKCREECEDVPFQDGKYYEIKRRSSGKSNGYDEVDCPAGTYSDNTFVSRVQLNRHFISDFALNLDVGDVGHLYDSFRMIATTSGVTFYVENSLLLSFRDYHFYSRVCQVCPEGTFSTAGQGACSTSCPDDMLKLADNIPHALMEGTMGKCVDACPGGYRAEEGECVKINCDPNQFLQANETCADCPVGYISDGTTSECAACSFRTRFGDVCTPDPLEEANAALDLAQESAHSLSVQLATTQNQNEVLNSENSVLTMDNTNLKVELEQLRVEQSEQNRLSEDLAAATLLNTQLQNEVRVAQAQTASIQQQANADLPTRIKTLNDSVLVSEWASRQNC